MLHGFPEFWYSWRHQLPALARAGFRALALDLPGYNESDGFPDVRSYRLSSLVKVLAEFLRNVAGGPAFVVGHDWGGVLAWRLATLYPELIRKLAILNAPHPATYREELQQGLGQWMRSWYVFFFQVPWLPEWFLQANDFAFFERAWRQQPIHPEAFREEDIAQYKQALSRPGVLTAGLNYYRAAFRYFRDSCRAPQSVPAPTLVIWGEQEAYLNSTLLDRLDRWVPDLRVERIPDASHWVQNDVPERVNELLIRFFTT